MLTFQKYQPFDRAAYYVPCLPEVLAYLPLFNNSKPLTLAQIGERAAAAKLPADPRDLAQVIILLAEAGYLETDWAACQPPAPEWHHWPAERGLSELVRCGLSQRLAAMIAPHYQGKLFATLAYEAEASWPFTDLANIRGFGYSSYRTFCNVVRAWCAQYVEAT